MPENYIPLMHLNTPPFDTVYTITAVGEIFKAASNSLVPGILSHCMHYNTEIRISGQSGEYRFSPCTVNNRIMSKMFTSI